MNSKLARAPRTDRQRVRVNSIGSVETTTSFGLKNSIAALVAALAMAGSD